LIESDAEGQGKADDAGVKRAVPSKFLRRFNLVERNNAKRKKPALDSGAGMRESMAEAGSQSR
jgi:hypothetical protein